MISVLIIPFSNFKQRVKAMNEFKTNKYRITVYETYLYVERNIRGVDGTYVGAN